MTKKTIRIATRASKLALTQSTYVMGMLAEANPRYAFEIVTVKTMGDSVQNVPLSQFRGIGVFVKELETALADGTADLAIHSLKDVPSQLPAHMQLASFPERVNAFDVIISRENCAFDKLPSGARVGTSSPRRLVQLKAVRPDLTYLDLRGNVDTRIGKLQRGDYDAIVAAAAGLHRLGIESIYKQELSLSQCIPAAGQGALAIECRRDDAEMISVARSINNESVEKAIGAERVFMRIIGGGCAVPVAVFAQEESSRFTLHTMAGDPSSGKIVRRSAHAEIAQLDDAAKRLAEEVLALCATQGIVLTNDHQPG